jgi:hypothetical protein
MAPASSCEKGCIIEQLGMTKYRQMQRLGDNVDAVARTRKTIIPGFINSAVRALRPTR